MVRRRALPDGAWEVVAGVEGQAGCGDGPLHRSTLHAPTDLCELPTGQLAVADGGNACLRLVDFAAGTVSTLAGDCSGAEGRADGPGGEARFSRGIHSIFCLPNCSILVADAGTRSLRRAGSAAMPCRRRQPHACSRAPPALAALLQTREH